jgi:hypothetical protein
MNDYLSEKYKDINYVKNDYINIYNKFIEEILNIFTNNINITNELNKLSNLDDETKINNGEKFNNLINDKNFYNFKKSKIKIFSHKNDHSHKLSISLFNDIICLKNILNNQEDNIKKKLWIYIHKIYILSELLKPELNQDKYKLNKIINIIELKETSSKQEYNNLDNMIDDIIESFQKIINNNPDSNIIENIMKISNDLSVKYSENIKNGNFNIEKIIQIILSKLGKLNISENSSIFSNLSLEKILGNLFNKNSNIKEESIIIDENFSTADVEVGKVDNDDTMNFKIGNVLKMMNNILPSENNTNPDINNNDSQVDNNIPNINNIFNNILSSNQNNDSQVDNNIPNINNIFNNILSSNQNNNLQVDNNIPNLNNINKMMGFISKMNNKSPENLSNLKNEMDTFFEKELGINMNNLLNNIKTS